MFNLENERSQILSDIRELGYESLRFSIFNDHSPKEWETRIEFNPESKEYEVYSTMDRASTNGKDSYQTFEKARQRFIGILKNVVFINQYYVEEGMDAEYSSPLWDQDVILLDTDKVDAIGVVDGALELLLADPNHWFVKDEQDHLLKLQEKLNNYIHFIESKQYVEGYGDDFTEKVINLTFQYAPSDNCLAFLVQVQKVLQPTDIRLKVVVPE
ncbi:TPA: Imm59 family immunity protein [Streptococcus suis]